jgi:dienelactone hydrolase
MPATPPRRHRPQRIRGVLALVAILTAACGSAGGDDGTAVGTTEAPQPLEVDVATETFVDTSRPTAAGSRTPARPDRTIVTRIAHPTSGGPYPLIVLSHGLTGHPDEYAETVRVWASDGFVVAAPAFPLTNRQVPGAESNIGDVANQPGDVSFVIDQVLAANADPFAPLHGLVDTEAIGVVGHSLGAATTWAVSFNSATRDERIDSAVVFAGLTLDMAGGRYEFGSGLPLLVLHGDEDDVPLDLDMAAWEQAASPKWFVALLGADHVPAFTDEESPYDELVNRTVLDFWHGTLDGDIEALDRVTDDATDPDLSSVQHE